ncbi:maleylpyruvate isomerase family mycothiol-dependent enzyme [Streptomyces alboniger]|uniref:Maleylpyruvate isomerase family mycothiol-dependent enzyme n=1 Tax=Streptomyces alboniger TaxID=132473 RepID=A0A5J6HKF6_STRAD|nr:maleylpyruvate isomerase family mycothiol-dependent enzyme [Streptomyces alboniger]QEV18933.1 maleylpyruvate isomerase family mycothiol-dependent enzyme [Streptomyces alboniger]
MPPAKKRTRSYDPAKIRTAVLAQFGNVRAAVRTLTPEQLARPTRLGDWTVHELAAHIAMVLGTVHRYLGLPEPAKHEVPLMDWPFVTVTAAAQVDEDTRAIAESAGTELDELFTRTLADIEASLAAASDGRLVPSRFGAMTLGDFLVTRTVELTVHTDDLNDAVPGLDVPYDRQALAACARLLADALALKAPGASTEVRIPPYAVVQCVEGPRHTRGTPPNVVETDPLTWIRLATGRTDWASALDAAKVSASGERADLSGLLPIMG